MDPAHRFDEAYYERFYLNPGTRVVDPVEHANLAQFVFSFASWHSLPMQTVLDVGAGIGLWRDWIAKNAPDAAYKGTELSPTLCAKHGYEQRDIARWRDRKRHDLVICQGVLQYLSDPDVAPAVANLAAMAQSLVFIEVMTRADLRERVDRTRTDTNVFVRNGSYYRGIFAKHLIAVGGGLYWPKDLPLPFWELDVAGLR